MKLGQYFFIFYLWIRDIHQKSRAKTHHRHRDIFWSHHLFWLSDGRTLSTNHVWLFGIFLFLIRERWSSLRGMNICLSRKWAKGKQPTPNQYFSCLFLAKYQMHGRILFQKIHHHYWVLIWFIQQLLSTFRLSLLSRIHNLWWT